MSQSYSIFQDGAGSILNWTGTTCGEEVWLMERQGVPLIADDHMIDYS
jgi:hypothetical protein